MITSTKVYVTSVNVGRFLLEVTGYRLQVQVTVIIVYKEAKQGLLVLTPYLKANSGLGHFNPLGYIPVKPVACTCDL